MINSKYSYLIKFSFETIGIATIYNNYNFLFNWIIIVYNSIKYTYLIFNLVYIIMIATKKKKIITK